MEGLSEEEFTSFLKFYYENVFPFDDFYKWLSYGQSKSHIYVPTLSN